jgi:hypothetical protein
MLFEPLLVVARIAAAFEALSVPYIVGGSLASSVHGIPRATQDVDLVAVLSLDHIEPLTVALASEFYVDGDMISDAIRRRASFNVVHLATMFKADIFVPGRDFSAAPYNSGLDSTEAHPPTCCVKAKSRIRLLGVMLASAAQT